MDRWLDETIDDIRERVQPGDEGSLWLLFFDEPPREPLVAAAFDDAMAHVDEQMIRNVAQIIDAAPAEAVLVAVPRRDGVPRPVDRQFWRDLRELLDDVSPRLVDLVVVGVGRHWSVQESDDDVGTAA
jgi:hypothetical protein